MRVKFYLKRPLPGVKAIANAKKKGRALPDVNPLSPTSIFALVNYNANTLKIYTSESIAPKYWNADTNSARNSPKFAEHPEFNARLNNIRSTINSVFMDYRNKHDHKIPDPSVLKPLIDRALKKGFVQTSYLSFFKEFSDKTVNGARINPRTRTAIKGTGGRGYITTHNHLAEFDKQWKRTLSFDTIDIDFYDDFIKYLASPPLSLSLNSIGSHIQRIKAVMSEAVDKKLTDNTVFRSKRFAKLSEDSDTIYLNEAEIKEIKGLDLSNEPTLDNVRDLFIIGCYTGLRFSDLKTLRPHHIQDGYIRKMQVKTNEMVIISVDKVIDAILEKRQGKFPPALSDVKNNKFLKDIAKKVKLLQEEVSNEKTIGNVKIIKSVEKWRLVASHTARRSFATNEYKAGVPALTLMAITGHKTEKAFLKYIRISPEEHSRIWAQIKEVRQLKDNLKAV